MDALALHEKTVGRLRRHEGKLAQLAREEDLSYSTLVKLSQGHMDNPTVGTLQQVIVALDAFEERYGVPESADAGTARRIDSPAAVASEFAIPPQGPATPASPVPESDPDGRRVEPYVESP